MTTQTPETPELTESEVLAIANSRGYTLISHKRDGAPESTRQFMPARDEPSSIKAASDRLEAGSGYSLAITKNLLEQLGPSRETREAAERWSDEIVWDEDDRAIITQTELNDLLARVITSIAEKG